LSFHGGEGSDADLDLHAIENITASIFRAEDGGRRCCQKVG